MYGNRRAVGRPHSAASRSCERKGRPSRREGPALLRVAGRPPRCECFNSPIPPNPLELLNRLNFDEFMIQVKSTFDVVIIDTPALSVGEDAAMIAVRTGAALAVARNAKTRVSAFNDLVQGLMNAGVSVVGSVLNDVPLTKAAKAKAS